MQAVVKEGAVKLLTADNPWGGLAKWVDSYLKLYSDATLEYKVGDEWHKIELCPYNNAYIANSANYAEMFDISGPSNPVSFAASSYKEAEHWLCTINFTVFKKNLKLFHPHPLTSHQTATRNLCTTCGTKFSYQASCCEFCPGFNLCSRCHYHFNELSTTIVKPPHHPHELFQFPVAKNEHGRNIFFPRAYNGSFNCDKCHKLSTGPLYHCSECSDYDECEECCASYSRDIQPKKPTNLWSYVAGFLSANGSLKIDGNTYHLNQGLDQCPQQSSIIAEYPWNLASIDTEPVPNAYFEVTFHNFTEDNQVAIGIGNQIFTPTKMLGGQQNSFGYFNDGKIAQNETPSPTLMPSYKPGDTVGAGILLDSFNQRRLFFTKNGQMIGMFPERVHKGMDCFPGVSFAKDSQAHFTMNFDGPFMFDTKTVPNYRTNTTTYIAQLPDEIVTNCLSFVAANPKQALEMRLVSKKFAQQVLGNEVWQPLFMSAWPLQNPKLKVKSWYKMYKARRAQLPSSKSFSPFPAHPIENCEFEFQCPMLWEKLTMTGSNENERFCEKCQKTVYSVQDAATLRDYADKGRCVSLVQKFVPVPLMGMPARIHTVPPPFEPQLPIGGPYNLMHNFAMPGGFPNNNA